jgi:hypothetical protein
MAIVVIDPGHVYERRPRVSNGGRQAAGYRNRIHGKRGVVPGRLSDASHCNGSGMSSTWFRGWVPVGDSGRASPFVEAKDRYQKTGFVTASELRGGTARNGRARENRARLSNCYGEPPIIGRPCGPLLAAL